MRLPQDKVSSITVVVFEGEMYHHEIVISEIASCRETVKSTQWDVNECEVLEFNRFVV